MRFKSRYLITIAALFILSAPAFADQIIVTPIGSTLDSLPVSAQAEFSFSTDSITLTLTNLQSDPTAVIQNISDFQFWLNQDTSGSSLTSSSGLERTVASGGTYTDGSTVSTGWIFSTPTTTSIYLNGLGVGSDVPAHTIIGAPDGTDVYSSANSSIAGNGPHNPFLAGSVTFDLSVPGVDANTTVLSAIFSFGTVSGETVGGGGPIPEPTSLLLLGSGLAGLAVWFRRKR
jgi:hypothetical protein